MMQSVRRPTIGSEAVKGIQPRVCRLVGARKRSFGYLYFLRVTTIPCFFCTPDINPHDICPILPFPSEDPKKGDRIASNFFAYITDDWVSVADNEWNVEPQSFLYADDRKPLDIYRSIISLDNERTPVFEALGGSTMVLSPSGNKISSMGVLMAALERGFPVMYVEALSYDVDWSKIDVVDTNATEFVHIWLKGEAYSNNESIYAK